MSTKTMLIMLRYGRYVPMDKDRTRIYKDPGMWCALHEEGWTRVTYNKEAACTGWGAPDESVITVADFVMWIITHKRPQCIQLMLHRELFLPLGGDQDSPSDIPLAMMLAMFEQAGITFQLATYERDNEFQVGQWVQVTDDYADLAQPTADHILTVGMLGQIAEDSLGSTTPGVDIMVKFVGRSTPHAYPCYLLQPVDVPDEAALAAARTKAEHAWEHVQERKRWIAILWPGLTAYDALRQLYKCYELLQRSTDPKAHATLLKRMAKLLDGFRFSPVGKRAVSLAERCRSLLNTPDPQELHALLAAVERWILDCVTKKRAIFQAQAK